MSRLFAKTITTNLPAGISSAVLFWKRYLWFWKTVMKMETIKFAFFRFPEKILFYE
jgi:hypothetical protein